MKRLFWERLAWLWVLCIPLAVAGGIGYGGQAYNPQSVAITGGTIGGTSVAGVAAAGAASPYNPANVAITGGTIGGTSVAGVAAAGAATPYNPASVTITGGTISISNSSAGTGVDGANSSTGIGVRGINSSTGTGVAGVNSSTGTGVYGGNSGSGIGVYGLNSGSGYGGAFDKLNVTNYLSLNGNMIMSATAPTIASGFGTGASVTFNNGTAAFYVDVGSGGTASTGTINMNVIATHYWSCAVTYDNDDVVTGKETIYSQISNQIVGFTNITRSTGVATPWTANDVFFVNCITM